MYFVNFINILRVGFLAKKQYVYVLTNSFVLQILYLLQQNGYISHFVREGNKSKVFLKYVDNVSVIRGITLLSTPGQRMYVKKNVKMVFKKGVLRQGLFFFSTAHQKVIVLPANFYSLGGEALFHIY